MVDKSENQKAFTGCEKGNSKAAEGKTVAMSAVVPGVDVGDVEEEVAGVDAGVGVARPVVTGGTAIVEVTGEPAEGPAPEEGERNIFYQSV